jgi:conjugal transfer pilus assembly protein TraW
MDANKMTINEYKRFKLLLNIFLIFYFTSSYAQNLGVHGEIYAIAEKDFLDLINERYLTMKANGAWRKVQEDFRKSMEQHSDRPKSLHIATTVTSRTFIFDPTLSLKRDIVDAEGKVLIKAGSTINPLKIMPLTKTLLFINGDDEKQIHWAKSKIQQFNVTKLILVNGSISETIKKVKSRVYFDQWGKLIHHFQIKHVPALVKQEGDVLKIEECMP